MNKITKLLNGKDAVFIIGHIGAGKSTLAKQIQGKTKIIEGITYVQADDRKKNLYIIQEIVKCRHENRKIIMTINGVLNSTLLPSTTGQSNYAWVFLGLSDSQVAFFSNRISELALKDIKLKSFNSMFNQQKTRPFMIVTYDSCIDCLRYEFGRFKPDSSERTDFEKVYLCDNSNHIFCKFELSDRYPTGVCTNCGKIK